MAEQHKKRLIVAVSGATGIVYAWHLLKVLAEMDDWETHLVLSNAAVLTARQELGINQDKFESLADEVHANRDIGAKIASGSFLVEGMIVVPCSMKSLSAIANGLSDNLIARAADVILKQRRKLVMVTRETPLNLIHLRNMTAATEAGAIIFPPVPAFYAGLESLDDMVGHTVGRILDLFGVEHQGLVNRWPGISDALKDKG
ncbi:MAG: 3-octaprenyl-4-hydroxybenzoate carboxy-lyase [Gammaproteobacteria bacterium]|nr:MAG: 3-octaprenyl-4-hydroxybenzoate carboxy-lyase [Gammaproteobacteria bacterium]